ncbi:MAG TPA: hypothetical protein VGP47_08795, partial [Parachlamydiaceae bacterium]|nr:hypothetical protein [Parachlamydiaceae bacterium]
MIIKLFIAMLCCISASLFPAISSENSIPVNWLDANTISQVIEEMTVEEKIGQLLMVHFNGERANKEATLLIQELYVGGFIYYNWANGLD